MEESREAPALGFKWRGSEEHSDGGMKPSGPGNSLHEHPQGTAHPACLPRLHVAPARSLTRCPSATHTQCLSLTSAKPAWQQWTCRGQEAFCGSVMSAAVGRQH